MAECSRCGKPATARTRGENFCGSCYTEFVGRKFRTAMAVFRVNGSQGPDSVPLLIVPVSFGASSIALVDLLAEMQRAQLEKHRMAGFKMRAIHIKGPRSLGAGATPTASGTGKQHNSDCVAEWPWPEIEFEEAEMAPVPTDHKLSRSSTQDVDSILVRQQILSVARANRATAVFGFSMTRLSELTLAETVKGRGAGIPALVAPDLMTDYAIYPLRDITLPELQKYVEIRGLSQYVQPDPIVPGITKMQSMDEIIHAYFSDVQENYPSVVSTVAKVASRLARSVEPCGFCQPADVGSTELCYACKQALGEDALASPLPL